MVEYTDTHVLCKRCGRRALKRDGHRRSVFWSAQCYLNSTGKSNREVVLSVNYCHNKGGYQHNLKLVEEARRHHGGDLRWSKQIFGPVHCNSCKSAFTLYWLGIIKQRGGIQARMPKCKGNSEEADAKETALKKWVAQYNRTNKGNPNKHNYVIASRHLVCKTCMVFTAEPLRYEGHALSKCNCGTIGMPWVLVARQARDSGISFDQLTNQVLIGEEVGVTEVTPLPRNR